MQLSIMAMMESQEMVVECYCTLMAEQQDFCSKACSYLSKDIPLLFMKAHSCIPPTIFWLTKEDFFPVSIALDQAGLGRQI